MRRDFNSQGKKRNLLSDKWDTAWNMYDLHVAWPDWLSRVWLMVMTIKAETGLSRNLSGEWEGNWMDLSLAARSINRNIMWPLTPKCLSTDKTPCVLSLQYISHAARSESGCLFLLFHEKPVKRLDSTVQLSRGCNSVHCHATHSKLLLHCI